jgi:hypothetical protein
VLDHIDAVTIIAHEDLDGQRYAADLHRARSDRINRAPAIARRFSGLVAQGLLDKGTLWTAIRTRV